MRGTESHVAGYNMYKKKIKKNHICIDSQYPTIQSQLFQISKILKFLTFYFSKNFNFFKKIFNSQL